jgi:hypothetical protein
MGQAFSRSRDTNRKGRPVRIDSVRARATSPVQYRNLRSASDRTYSRRVRGDGTSRPQRTSTSTRTSKYSKKREESELETQQKRSRDVPRVPRSGHGSHKAKTERRTTTEPRNRARRNDTPTETEEEETKECVACTDMRPLSRFPEDLPTSECEHEADICRKCIRTWLASESETKQWDAIKCPLCPELMQHEDMQIFASSKTLAR